MSGRDLESTLTSDLGLRDRPAVSLLIRVGLMLTIVLSALSIGMLAPEHAAAQEISPEQQLVERYAPVAMLRAQSSQCDKSGEGYFPAPVDFLFDNPDIQLRHDTGGDYNDDPILLEGLTPSDLVNAGPDTYLDFPGNPRDPGCEYEEYFKAKVEELGLEPTTYARIAVDEATGRLYIQYWFYYYFNDWNNTHESDWEMIQLVFEGSRTVEEALERGPTIAAYAQHGGGETSSWSSDKVEKQGDRPVVYPSAGSHATYYDQNTFIGWGENGTAFGCDNTTAPAMETPLNVILVPETIDPDGEFAYLLYQGNWGQKEFAVYEGPKGPNMGTKWSDPTAAMADWRGSTLQVPDTSGAGISATDLFCSLSEWGSKAFTYLGSHLWATLAIVLGTLAVIGFLVYKAWSFFTEAIDIYGNELISFLGIGSLVIPIGILGGFVVQALNGHPPVKWIEESFNNSTGGTAAAALAVGGLQQVLMVLIVVPAVVYAMKDIRRGIRPGVIRSYKGSLKYLPVTVPALIVFGAILAVGGIALILLPVAIYILVRLQFFPQAAIIDEETPFTTSLGASWEATKGHFVKVLAASIGFQFLATIPGPLIGALVLIVGGSRVGFANFLSSFIYALTIPIATIAVTMVYHRIRDHKIVEPDMVTRPADEVEGLRENVADSVQPRGAQA